MLLNLSACVIIYIDLIMEEKFYYLDSAATTRMFDETRAYAESFLCEEFYNPSAVYFPSVGVKRKITEARRFILDALGADSGNLYFTGSATEANNMVIFSQRLQTSKRFLFGVGEHPSVLECAKELERRGYKVEYIPLDITGKVDIEKYQAMLGSDVAFVSVQHVSNETGAINPIKELVRLAKKVNSEILFHSDGVQAFLKLPYSVLDLGVDYYTVSAHKIYGPKGIGGLFVKKGVKIKPLIFGGGQEEGVRSGTENVFNIMAFYSSAKKMLGDREKNFETVQKHKSELLAEFDKLNIKYKIHGNQENPYIMNICLSDKVRGETLLHALEARNVFVSTGSACSASKHYNATLEAMGIDKDEILKSIRISISPYLDFDAKIIARIIKEELNKFGEK